MNTKEICTVLISYWILMSLKIDILFTANATASATLVWYASSGTQTPSSFWPLPSSFSTLTCTAPTSSLRGRWSWRTLLRTFEVLCSSSLHHMQLTVPEPLLCSSKDKYSPQIEFCPCILLWLIDVSIQVFCRSWPRKPYWWGKALLCCPQQILRVLEMALWHG